MHHHEEEANSQDSSYAHTIGTRPPGESTSPSSPQKWVRSSGSSLRSVPIPRRTPEPHADRWSMSMIPCRGRKGNRSLPDMRSGGSGPMESKSEICDSLRSNKLVVEDGNPGYFTSRKIRRHPPHTTNIGLSLVYTQYML